jgi:hypothetical protein
MGRKYRAGDVIYHESPAKSAELELLAHILVTNGG